MLYIFAYFQCATKRNTKTFRTMVEKRRYRIRRTQSQSSLNLQKGDTNTFENYIPISFLNTLYKIFAAIIQRRLAEKIDPYLQKTQLTVNTPIAISSSIEQPSKNIRNL